MSQFVNRCTLCGAAQPPKGKSRSGRIPGVIESGSLPDRVINFLHDYPEQELTAEDVSVSFDEGNVKPRDVGKRLGVALRYGYLEAVISPRGKRVFRKPRK